MNHNKNSNRHLTSVNHFSSKLAKCFLSMNNSQIILYCTWTKLSSKFVAKLSGLAINLWPNYQTLLPIYDQIVRLSYQFLAKLSDSAPNLWPNCQTQLPIYGQIVRLSSHFHGQTEKPISISQCCYKGTTKVLQKIESGSDQPLPTGHACI